MRKIVIFTMILTLIFSMVGCTAHSEPDKKAVESSSTNVIIDTTQSEELTEKTESETVEKSTFTVETAQPPAAETGAEKVSIEPIFSQTTTANNEPKQDTHTQEETPKSGILTPEITTNTVAEVTTAVAFLNFVIQLNNIILNFSFFFSSPLSATPQNYSTPNALYTASSALE